MSEDLHHPNALVETAAVGKGTRVWAFAHVMKGASVGRDGNIGDHSFIESGAVIGDRVTVKNGVSVWDKVTIEDDVFLGPNAVFTNERWPVSRRKGSLDSTVVRKGACIGANAVIVCGTTVGRYAFVGAGSVVTSDVPDHALVYGNPARLSAYLCECRHKLKFVRGKAACGCGLRYVQNSKKKVTRVP